MESGNLFFDNKDSGESIYSFFLAQLHYTEKFILIKLEISDNYENYILEYLDVIKRKNGDKYMLTHKKSKFVFYNFNNFLNRIGQQPKTYKNFC